MAEIKWVLVEEIAAMLGHLGEPMEENYTAHWEILVEMMTVSFDFQYLMKTVVVVAAAVAAAAAVAVGAAATSGFAVASADT